MSGLTLDERVRRAVEMRVSEMVSSGGLSMGRAAIEILYLLPPDFVAVYTELFHKALTGADGGSDARGEAAERTRALGRAPGKAARSTGNFRGVWTIGDERALALKDRADKRLRAISRDVGLALNNIRDEDDLAAVNRKRLRDGKLPVESESRGVEVERLRCPKCQRFLDMAWLYCPSCGAKRRA